MKRILSKKILWTVVFCFFSFFLFDLLEGLLGLSYWKPDKEDTLVIYEFQRGSERPDIVIMGSSRIRFGILPTCMAGALSNTPEEIPDIFNLGQDSGGMRISHTILRDVLQGEKCPKLLLLDVKVWGLNSNSSGVNNAYFRYYASQWDIVRSLDISVFSGEFGPRAQGFVRSISNLLWLIRRNPWQASYQERLARLRENKGAEFRYAESSLAGMTKKERGRFMGLRFFMLKDLMEDFQISGPAQEAFEDVIVLCRKRNIKLILLAMPLHPDDPEINHYQDEYSVFMTYVTETCNRENIPFYDLQEDGPALSDEHFGDYDHMNTEGAEIVSTYVAENILRPEMRHVNSLGREPSNTHTTKFGTSVFLADETALP
jgi:hypothetical protein